jgi:hypothetical protein
VSANRVVATGWMERSVVVGVAGETLSDRKNSNRCDSERDRGEHSHERSGRKERKGLIDNL